MFSSAIIVLAVTGTLSAEPSRMAQRTQPGTPNVQGGAEENMRLGKRAYDDLFRPAPLTDANGLPLPPTSQPTKRPAPHVVCGMLIIAPDPTIDPQMAVDPQKDLAERGRAIHHTLRLLRPPMCQPQQ